jgi:hypothetical protein
MSQPEQSVPDATLADLVIQLQRIADALAPKVAAICGEAEADGAPPCVLGPDHIGYHVTADGRHWWLEA